MPSTRAVKLRRNCSSILENNQVISIPYLKKEKPVIFVLQIEILVNTDRNPVSHLVRYYIKFRPLSDYGLILQYIRPKGQDFEIFKYSCTFQIQNPQQAMKLHFHIAAPVGLHLYD